jgi:hypothetical protein
LGGRADAGDKEQHDEQKPGRYLHLG